jgi:tryptophanyl-tRNA synthetase
MEPETIRRRVLSFDDAPGRPADSAVFRMMAFASTYPPDEVARLREVCEAGGERWAAAREAYADHAVDLLSHW